MKKAYYACSDIASNMPMPCADVFNHYDYHQAKDNLINSAIYHSLGRSFHTDDADSFRFDIYTNTEIEVLSIFYKDILKGTITTIYGNPVTVEFKPL